MHALPDFPDGNTDQRRFSNGLDNLPVSVIGYHIMLCSTRHPATPLNFLLDQRGDIISARPLAFPSCHRLPGEADLPS